MLHSMFDFPENAGYSRKLEKAKEHYTEQCRHYIPKQNINFDESLTNYEEEKKEEEKLRTLYKYEKTSTNTLCLQ